MSADGGQLAGMATQAGVAVLSDMCEERIYATGAQLAVSVDGSISVSEAVGAQLTSRPLSDAHLFNVWCASKPVPAVILMGLLENAGLSLDAPLSTTNPDHGYAIESTVGSVLSHSCGLRHPDLVTANLMPWDDALMAARSQKDIPSVSAFSEFTASVIISDLIEAVSGQETETVLNDFLKSHGLRADATFRISDEALQRPLDHLGFYITGLPVLARPLYSDALACIAQQHRDVMGAYMNARGLCEFYRLVGLVLRGHRLGSFPTPEFLNDAVDNHRRIRSHDETLHKQCGFAAGFMTDLADHGYGSTISPDAIGHTGLVGSPFGFYDPKRRLAVAAIVNGMTADFQDSDHWRPKLIDTICQTIDAAVNRGD